MQSAIPLRAATASRKVWVTFEPSLVKTYRIYWSIGGRVVLNRRPFNVYQDNRSHTIAPLALLALMLCLFWPWTPPGSVSVIENRPF